MTALSAPKNPLVTTLYAAALAGAAFGAMFSSNVTLWCVVVACLPLTVSAAGKATRFPIILAHLGLVWAAIFGSVLAWDLDGTDQVRSADEVAAILLSLGGLLAIALGYRCAFATMVDRPARGDQLDVRRLLVAYVLAFGLTSALTALAYVSPALTQPVLAFRGVRLLVLYLLAAQIFANQKGYAILALALCAEVGEGVTGYIASYQLPVLVVLVASISSYKGSVGARQLVGGMLLAVLLFWASLVWTAVKPEYRAWLANGDSASTAQTVDRIGWISAKVGNGDIDYSLAFERLAERIGYTHFYAVALPRLDQVKTTFWRDAIANVIMPRALFSDKAALNDTAITVALTGLRFGETSVSIGFMAQTHADFGFPGMYVILFGVGLGMGAIVRLFQSRQCAQIARDGFGSAAIVYKFVYEQNVEKALGGIVLSTLALWIVITMFYPRFELWLKAPRARPSEPRRYVTVAGH